MWHGSAEDQIRHLKNELDHTRRTIVDLMPSDISELLHKSYNCRTRDEAYQWQRDVVNAIIEKAKPIPGQFSYWGVERAYCPLCNDGSQGPYDEGFAIPEGLRRHLTGWGNACQCRVTEAAFALAREYWTTTVEETERQKRAADTEDKAHRKKTEVLFKCGPNEEPDLIDAWCWLGDKPRTQEELQWAEERLTQLGFDITLDDRVKSYLKNYGGCQVYADPREKKKISFYVYPNNMGKRRRRPSHIGNFFLMDSWKHDLIKEFEERCHNALPEEMRLQLVVPPEEHHIPGK